LVHGPCGVCHCHLAGEEGWPADPRRDECRHCSVPETLG
jgi:hypothetical protein